VTDARKTPAYRVIPEHADFATAIGAARHAQQPNA
jgi:hypothetical protein